MFEMKQIYNLFFVDAQSFYYFLIDKILFTYNWFEESSIFIEFVWPLILCWSDFYGFVTYWVIGAPIVACCVVFDPDGCVVFEPAGCVEFVLGGDVDGGGELLAWDIVPLITADWVILLGGGGGGNGAGGGGGGGGGGHPLIVGDEPDCLQAIAIITNKMIAMNFIVESFDCFSLVSNESNNWWL